MTNSENKADYVTVRIPRELANEIDQIIQSGTLGYRSRAEMVSEALRLRIGLLRFNNSMNSNMLNKNRKE